MAPRVSVIILNYNGTEYVVSCLSSILRSNYSNFEIIFVDNDSRDNSWELARDTLSNAPNVKLIKNKHNIGYAGGNNKGASCADGKYLFFLNVDTEIDPNCLEVLVKHMERNPSVAVVQPKLLLMRNKKVLDACGTYLTTYGFLHHIGLLEEDVGQFDQPFEVLSVKGAAFMVRSELFKRVGGFDDDYFIYYEEHDLCLRLRLLGYSVVYVPNAVVYHAWGGVINNSNLKQAFIYYDGYKNYVQTFLKEFSFYYIIRLLTPYLIFGLIYAVYSSLHGSRLALYYATKALLWNLKNWRRTYHKRIEVRHYYGKVPDGVIMKKFLKKMSLAFWYRYKRDV